MRAAVRTLNHVSVTTRDLDRSLAFYQGLLGLPVLESGVSESPQLREIIGLGPVTLRFAELDLGGDQFLELFEYVPAGSPLSQQTRDPGCVHFAVAVDDARAVNERLVAAGVTVRSGPVVLTTGAWVGVKAFYCVDPDGVTVEILEFPAGVELAA